MALFPGGGFRPRTAEAEPASTRVAEAPALNPMNGGGMLPQTSGTNGANGNGAHSAPVAAPENAATNGNAAATNGNGAAGNGASSSNAPAGGDTDFQAREMQMEIDDEDEDFDDEMLRLSHKVHNVLVEELGGQQFKADDRDRLRPIALQVMTDVLRDEKPLMPRRKQFLIELVLDEVLGFGPIQYLLNDPTISEVMVNSPTDIFIERKGKIKRSRRKFIDDRHVLNIIDRIVRPLGKTANARTPMVDGRLPDGSRVNIVVPPLALKGPGMSIRKFFKKKFDGDDMIKFGSMTPAMKCSWKAPSKVA